MEKKNIILILIIIFFILVLSIKCNENFENNIINKPLLTNISNSIYCIDKKDELIKIKNFDINSNYGKIYELENIDKQKYYYIYLNEEILKYIDDKKIFLVMDGSHIISSFPEFYKLYKTSNNKLYYLIKNQNKYLALDKNNKNIVLSNNEEEGIIWIF